MYAQPHGSASKALSRGRIGFNPQSEPPMQEDIAEAISAYSGRERRTIEETLASNGAWNPDWIGSNQWFCPCIRNGRKHPECRDCVAGRLDRNPSRAELLAASSNLDGILAWANISIEQREMVYGPIGEIGLSSSVGMIPEILVGDRALFPKITSRNRKRSIQHPLVQRFHNLWKFKTRSACPERDRGLWDLRDSTGIVPLSIVSFGIVDSIVLGIPIDNAQDTLEHADTEYLFRSVKPYYEGEAGLGKTLKGFLRSLVSSSERERMVRHACVLASQTVARSRS